jgi:hypothetical protein
VRQDAAGQENLALARRQHARGGERGTGPRVLHAHPLARRQRSAEAGQTQAVVAGVSGIVEDERLQLSGSIRTIS